jgi:Leucine-rich repeat (LRR) protein
MKWCAAAAGLTCLLCLALLLADVQTQGNAPLGTAIDPDTIAAYRKIGGDYGGWVTDGHGKIMPYVPGPEVAAKGTPGFRFLSFPDAKLPEVAVPFGLDLSVLDITDQHLKGLAHLKNLTALDLRARSITDAGLKELLPLKNLRALCLWHTQVTDVGLKDLAKLTNLTTLQLMHTQVTDAGLKELAPLKNLRALNLDATRVTDAGLKELLPLQQLTSLELYKTNVTDTGLKNLASLKNLTRLDLTETKVTQAGAQKLHKVLPGCDIPYGAERAPSRR